MNKLLKKKKKKKKKRKKRKKPPPPPPLVILLRFEIRYIKRVLNLLSFVGQKKYIFYLLLHGYYFNLIYFYACLIECGMALKFALFNDIVFGKIMWNIIIRLY